MASTLFFRWLIRAVFTSQGINDCPLHPIMAIHMAELF
jgi:hypothetical protein